MQEELEKRTKNTKHNKFQHERAEYVYGIGNMLIQNLLNSVDELNPTN